MWFTDRPCSSTRNELWVWLITFAVFIGNASILARQLTGTEEVSMLLIVFTFIVSGGSLFAVASFIMRLYGDCFEINNWWLFLVVIMPTFTLIINELTYEELGPAAMFPFMFLYPSLAIRSSDERAAKSSAIVFAIYLAVATIDYIIITTSSWWYYGPGNLAVLGLSEKIYRLIISESYLTSVLGMFMALLPIGIFDFYLPGYYMWRHKTIRYFAFVVLILVIYFLTYGQVLRTVTNVAYGQYIVI